MKQTEKSITQEEALALTKALILKNIDVFKRLACR